MRICEKRLELPPSLFSWFLAVLRHFLLILDKIPYRIDLRLGFVHVS